MNKLDIFKTLPEEFRIATKEDLPLVTLTLAQAFTDYKYPIPTVEVSYSALLKFNYKISEVCTINAMENGAVLSNEDFSAVILVTEYAKRADYNVDLLYDNLKENAGIVAAENMLSILNYICNEESKLNIDDKTYFIDMFAVQTPRQGQKLGSKLMRELFRQCKEINRDVFFIQIQRRMKVYIITLVLKQ